MVNFFPQVIAIGGTEDKPKNLIKETSNMIKPAQGTLSTNALGFSLLLTAGSFFVRFQKNSRPILLKKLNLSEANSDFTKKTQEISYSNNGFTWGSHLLGLFTAFLPKRRQLTREQCCCCSS